MILRHNDVAGQGETGAECHDVSADMSDDPDSTSAGPMVAVDVRASDWQGDVPDIEANVRRAVCSAIAAGVANVEGIEVSIVLADDATVRALNRDYRDRDAPTNVLAFPQEVAAPEQAAGPLLLGDVILAYETVRREAVAQGKTLSDHACHLVVHGLLHLCGFDHHTEASATDMERREIAILAALGIADPYVERRAL